MVSLVVNDDGNGGHSILLNLMFLKLIVLISVLWMMMSFKVSESKCDGCSSACPFPLQ